MYKNSRSWTFRRMSTLFSGERSIQWRVETDRFGLNVNVKPYFQPFGFAVPFVPTDKKIRRPLWNKVSEVITFQLND